MKQFLYSLYLPPERDLGQARVSTADGAGLRRPDRPLHDPRRAGALVHFYGRARSPRRGARAREPFSPDARPDRAVLRALRNRQDARSRGSSGQARAAALRRRPSRLVSKYIGETEKHIDEALASSERSGAVLLLDEADSLFAARTEISSSNDRFANLEVGYLLQRIEHHDGLVILATNLLHTIDDAFLRRFHTRVEFPFRKPRSAGGSGSFSCRRSCRAPRSSSSRRSRSDTACPAATFGTPRSRPSFWLNARESRSRTSSWSAPSPSSSTSSDGSRASAAERDPGDRLRGFAEALERVLDGELRRRFLKEIHLIHGSPTKETLAGRRPAISLASTASLPAGILAHCAPA